MFLILHVGSEAIKANRSLQVWQMGIPSQVGERERKKSFAIWLSSRQTRALLQLVVPIGCVRCLKGGRASVCMLGLKELRDVNTGPLNGEAHACITTGAPPHTRNRIQCGPLKCDLVSKEHNYIIYRYKICLRRQL